MQSFLGDSWAVAAPTSALFMGSCGIVCGTDDAIVLCDAGSCLDTVALLADAIECAEDGTV